MDEPSLNTLYIQKKDAISCSRLTDISRQATHSAYKGGFILTWSFSHKIEYLLLSMADFTTCISRSSMRKFRSPNQNTTLWEKSLNEESQLYNNFCNYTITSVITLVMMVHVMPTYSWSRTPEAAWPSNCCCCRMLSKSSMRWSEFSMWAGRWQLRKQMVWPNTDMRALTPPLFPCNINH